MFVIQLLSGPMMSSARIASELTASINHKMPFNPLQKKKKDINSRSKQQERKKQKNKSLKLIEQGDKPVWDQREGVSPGWRWADSLCCPLLVRSAGVLNRRSRKTYSFTFYNSWRTCMSVCSWDLLCWEHQDSSWGKCRQLGWGHRRAKTVTKTLMKDTSEVPTWQKSDEWMLEGRLSFLSSFEYFIPIYCSHFCF